MFKCEQLVVDSRLEALLKVHRWFKDIVASLEPEFAWARHHSDHLTIAIAEGFTNAVRHAHASLPPETPISIDVAFRGDRIDIQIWDQGKPFDPTHLREPKLGSIHQQGGYGWFLLRNVADTVTYHRHDQQNCLSITQHRFQSEA